MHPADSPPDGRTTLPTQPRVAGWMDSHSQAADTAMDTTSSTHLAHHLPGSSVFASHSSPLRSAAPASLLHTPIQSSVQSPLMATAKTKRVSDGTSSSLTSSSAHTSPAQAAPTSAASAASTDSGPSQRPQDSSQNRARKSQSRSSVKKPRSKKPKRDERAEAVADADLYTVLQLDHRTSLLCFLVTEQQRQERMADAEANAASTNKHKFAAGRSKQQMHGYICVREVEAKMLRHLPQYKSRDSQSFRSSIRQAFEKLHYWPLEATRPEVMVLKENDFLKMNAPNTCVYPISHIISFLRWDEDPSGNLKRWGTQLEQRWAAWMDANGYELSTDSSAENSSDATSDSGHPPPPPSQPKPKPKPRARKQSNPRRAARVDPEDEEDADEEREESEDESMGKGQSNPRGSPSSLAARRNVQPPPLQQHSPPQAAQLAYQRQHHPGFGVPSHDSTRYGYHDSGNYGHHAQPVQHHQHASHAHHEHGLQSHGLQSHGSHAHGAFPLASSVSMHRRRGSSAQDMRDTDSMGDHHSYARPLPSSSRALPFVPSSHQVSHPAPFSFHQPAAAAAASGYGPAGLNDPFGHAPGQYTQPLRPLMPVVQIRQPVTLILSPTSLAAASDLRHSPDLMSPASPSFTGYLPLSKGRTSPSDFLRSPLADHPQPPPMLATSQHHHHLQAPSRSRTGSELLPAGFSAIHEPWSGRSATENFLPATLASPSLQSAFGSPGLSGSHPMHTVTTTTTTTTYAQQPYQMHIQSPQPHMQQHMTQQQQQMMQQQPHQSQTTHRSHNLLHPPSHSGAVSFPAPSHAHSDLSPMAPLPPSMRLLPPPSPFGAAVVQLAESIPPPAALNQRRRSLSVPAMLVEMANMCVEQDGEAAQPQNN